MNNDFRSARFWARALVEAALYPGARAIDATMGNGGDTCWLCETVGESGHVYAFDIQASAIESTRAKLQKAQILPSASDADERENEAPVTLIHAGHEHMKEHVSQPVDAIVFNLGWLPGAQHGLTTRVETTLAAVDQALELLKTDGVMTVCIYPGHEEGAREREALLNWAKNVNPRRFDVLVKSYLNQPNDPPLMIAVHKLKTKENAK